MGRRLAISFFLILGSVFVLYVILSGPSHRCDVASDVASCIVEDVHHPHIDTNEMAKEIERKAIERGKF